MKNHGSRLLGLVLCLAFIVPVAHARHFKVYGYKTLDADEVELVYWTDYVVDSDVNMPYFGQTVERDGLLAHTFELEYGITDRWTASLYFDYEDPSGADLELIQQRFVAARYRFGEPGRRFFDGAIYFEYLLPDPDYQGEAKEKLETRIILEKQLGENTLRLNPKLEKVMSGPDVEEGLELAYSAGVYRPFREGMKIGLELHGELGEWVDTKSPDDQEHYVLPAVTVELMEHLEWNVGVAFGLTDASDDAVVKSILEWEL